MARVIGDLPRPWVFTIGVDAGTALSQSLQSVFPTITAIDDVRFIRQVDYDAAIVVDDKQQSALEDHLQVVWFSDSGVAPTSRSGKSAPYVLREDRWEDGDHASRFAPTQLATDEGLVALAEGIAPPPASSYMVLSSTSWLTGLRHPLLVEVGGKEGALAAVYDRTPENTSEVWCLPTLALDESSDWVRVALRRWQHRFPQAFPTTDWAADQRWMTVEEQQAHAGLSAHDTDTAALIETRRRERIELEREVDRSRTAADTGLRRLLTINGNPLVEAVVDALEQLDFNVIQSDDVLLPGQKREDLLVEDGDWISVTEVKGYEKGNAKQNDLLPLGSAVESYVLRTGKRPAARWYIVNQSFKTAPDDRTRPLASAGDTVDKFANQQGLVIDTRELFLLTRAVIAAEMSAQAARQLLKDAVGVFDYPRATLSDPVLEAGPQQLSLPAGKGASQDA